jgi:metal-responsive CopG/Arc/MetJ family transcriptional regulator
MKIAISVPDPIFAAAEKLAAHLGKSRSQLYAEAVRAFVEANSTTAVTEQLNAVYAGQPATIDPALALAQSQALAHSLGNETW